MSRLWRRDSFSSLEALWGLLDSSEAGSLLLMQSLLGCLCVYLSTPEARGPRALVWKERASTASLCVSNPLAHWLGTTMSEHFYMLHFVYLEVLCSLLSSDVSASALPASSTLWLLSEVNTGSPFFQERRPERQLERASRILLRIPHQDLLQRCAGNG